MIVAIRGELMVFDEVVLTAPGEASLGRTSIADVRPHVDVVDYLYVHFLKCVCVYSSELL